MSSPMNLQPSLSQAHKAQIQNPVWLYLLLRAANTYIKKEYIKIVS